MKKILPFLIPVLALVAAQPAARADDDKSATKTEKKELRVISGPDHRTIIKHLDSAEKEPVTFLGVETSPVSPTLTAQLGLQDGAGLVVGHVVPDSPAAAVLKQHDILVKLDDQLLIEQRQLSVLVRNHKEGDEVTLTYLRAGKQATAKVKLAKHDLPKMTLDLNQPNDVFAPFGGMFGNGNFNARTIAPGAGAVVGVGNDADRILGMINGGVALPGMQHMNIVGANGGAGERNISVSVTVNTGNSHVALDDDQGSLELTIADGKKQLVAKDKKGDEIFSGPINTPEERKALPDAVRGRLEKLEDSTQFSYKTGTDFKTETKVARPRGQGIAVPAQPLAPARPVNFF